MNTTGDLNEFFDAVLANPGSDTIDVDAAIRSGRRRRRRRTTATLLSVVGSVAALGWLVASALDHPALDSGPATVSGVATDGATTPTWVNVTEPSQMFGYWWATELNGQDVHADRARGEPLSVWFGADPASGELWWTAPDGCNQHGGQFRVSDGRLAVEGGNVTLVGCIGGGTRLDNPDTVRGADQARLFEATPTTPAQLELLADGQVIARYVTVPDADAQRKGGTVLTGGRPVSSGPQPDPNTTGQLTVGPDECLRIDNRTAVFPTGTSWSWSLGLLILPDGTTAQPGQTILGSATSMPTDAARTHVADPTTLDACTWTGQAQVFTEGAVLTVSD